MIANCAIFLVFDIHSAPILSKKFSLKTDASEIRRVFDGNDSKLRLRHKLPITDKTNASTKAIHVTEFKIYILVQNILNTKSI